MAFLWTNKGMAAEGVLRSVCAAVKQLEAHWWRKRLEGEEGRRLRASLAEAGLEPSRMGFHGEVMFLLLGVKPAVLCTFPAAACGPEAPTPSQLAVHYATQVMLPALRSGGGSASTNTSSDERTTWEVSVAGKRLLVGVVDANVSSAYCDEVGGSLIVYSPDDQRAALASRLLSPTAQLASEQFAVLLDYPTHLKEGEELEDQQRRQPVIVEVGYWVVTSSAEGPELLTSYGAEEAEVPTHVAPHFRRYAAACAEVGVQLKLGITRVSD